MGIIKRDVLNDHTQIEITHLLSRQQDWIGNRNSEKETCADLGGSLTNCQGNRIKFEVRTIRKMWQDQIINYSLAMK